LLTFALTILNWKLIVHAHYLNHDILITLLILLNIFFVFKYLERPANEDTKYTLLAGIFYGLAIGTKVTVLISLPIFSYVYFSRKDWKGFFGLVLTSLVVFIITNPFSIIYAEDFVFRVLSMLTKEGGIVFDSVDKSYFKYIRGLGYMLTPPVFLISLFGIYHSLKKSISLHNIILVGHLIIYFVFYSIQSRRVDRWLLPMLPILIIYFSYAVENIYAQVLKRAKVYQMLALVTAVLISVVYLFFPLHLLRLFQRQTPKSAAYLWAQKNLPEKGTKLVYTEEGLEPMTKLPHNIVKKVGVYEDEGANLFFPELPFGQDYLIISSRPMENYHRPEVRTSYPDLVKRWDEFQNMYKNETTVELIKKFEQPEPNLIPLSNVYIYEATLRQ
jgi:hypothetical protein